MVDQSHHLFGRGGGRPPEAPDHLCAVLAEHVRVRFPGRIDDATIHRLVAEVVSQWHHGPLRDEAGEPARGLTADASRAALRWLRANGEIPADSVEYDDLLAETLFGGRFNAAEIRAGMQAMVNGQPAEFRILTSFLDVAELDGHPPQPSDLARWLHTAEPDLTTEFIDLTIVRFYRLLTAQKVSRALGEELS